MHRLHLHCCGRVAGIVLLLVLSPVAWGQGSNLRVNANNHFLVKTDGTPFVWFGDTAWELFHRLSRTEAIQYLDNRQAKKFTIIQAVALAELDGLNTANAHGDRPLLNNNPDTPWTITGNNPSNATEYDYWDHVDYVVDQANARGMYVGFLPTWGRWMNENNIFSTTSAENYGRFLGQRYGSKKVVWILGGDRLRPAAFDSRVCEMTQEEGEKIAFLLCFYPRRR